MISRLPSTILTLPAAVMNLTAAGGCRLTRWEKIDGNLPGDGPWTG